MPWPTPQDYNEAIQNPALNLDDPELRAGTPELTPLGLPRPITGGFASVYRMRCGQRDWAVRCFLREIPDQQRRYAAISRHLAAVHLPYTVGFAFLSTNDAPGNELNKPFVRTMNSPGQIPGYLFYPHVGQMQIEGPYNVAGTADSPSRRSRAPSHSSSSFRHPCTSNRTSRRCRRRTRSHPTLRRWGRRGRSR